MPESRGKAQETAARRDGAGTARGWPVCISGVSVQAERSERPSVVVGIRRNSKGTRREFEFYLLKDWAFRGQASSRDPASRFTNAAPNSARRNFYVPSATTARAIGALNSTASCTKRDKSKIKARVLGQAWRQFVVRGRVPNGRRRHRAHRLWAQTVHGRAQGVVRIPI